MPFENANTIKELNPIWPVSNDINVVADFTMDGDDHLRNIKEVLEKIFLGAASLGFAIPITATEVNLNNLVNITSNLQNQIDAAKLGSVMVGGIIEYSGLFTDIPASYLLCDGTNGTPNLGGRFVYGTNTEAEFENLGGDSDSLVITHTHTDTHGHTTVNSTTDGNHFHTFPSSNTVFAGVGVFVDAQQAGALRGQTTSQDGSHTHTVTVNNSGSNLSLTGSSGVGRNAPPYIRLAYIQRKF